MKTAPMKHTLVLTASIAFLLTKVHAAPITPGNLVVERVGDGTTALSGTSTNVSVLEFTTGGTPQQTLNLTSTLTSFSESVSATSAGGLNVSTGGSLITVPGYDANSGVSGVVGSASAREFASISLSGTISSQTLSPSTAYQTNNFRSIVSDGSGNFWGSGTASGAGGTGGVHYITSGGTATQLSTTVTNTRWIDVFSNQLWISSAAGAFLGISKVGTGLPTTSGQTISLSINLGTGASPYGFFLFDSDANGEVDRAWIADDRTSAGGGIQRWNFDGSAWSQDYQLRLDITGSTLTNTGSGLLGLRGITGSVNGGTVSLFATSSDGSRLVSFTDTVASGVDPTAFTTLASAGTNFAFRGVDIIAVPEPSALGSLIFGVASLAGWRRFRRLARS